MAAWDQVPLEAPGALFSRQPDYADTMAKILSSPGATFRAARTDTRDYGLELDKAAALKKYQEGSLAVDAEKNRLAAEAQGVAGPYGGNAIEAQDSNVLLTGDPSSPMYELAFQRQYLTPKAFTTKDAQGNITTVFRLPVVPPGIRRPTSAHRVAGPTAPAPAPDGTTPAPAPAGATPAPAPDGTTPAPAPDTGDWTNPPDPLAGKDQPTEAENRALARLTVGSNAYEVANKKWDALTTGWGKFGSFSNKGGKAIGGFGEFLVDEGSNALMSDDYQQAASAVDSLAQTYLYAMSGANAPVAEKNEIIDSIMPRIGDGPEQLKQKRHTMEVLKKALEAQAAIPGPSPPPIDPALAVQQLRDQAAAGAPAPAGGAGAPAPAGGADGADEAPVEQWHRDPKTGELMPGAG